MSSFYPHNSPIHQSDEDAVSDTEKMLLKMIATKDSEYDYMLSARRGARSRTNGFEGCANLGKGCNFDGFYLCRYSREGLCSDCEQTAFLERYTGCIFCGAALDLCCAPACLMCQSEAQDWITDNTIVIQDPDETQKECTRAFVNIWAHCLFNRPASSYQRTNPTRKGELGDKWPGFKTNKGKIIIPKEMKITIHMEGKMQWGDEGTHVLENALVESGIFLFSNVQLSDKTKCD